MSNLPCRLLNHRSLALFLLLQSSLKFAGLPHYYSSLASLLNVDYARSLSLFLILSQLGYAVAIFCILVYHNRYDLNPIRPGSANLFLLGKILAQIIISCGAKAQQTPLPCCASRHRWVSRNWRKI